MHLQNVTVGFAHKRAKFGIVQPRREGRDHEASRMNSYPQHSQPLAVRPEVCVAVTKGPGKWRNSKSDRRTPALPLHRLPVDASLNDIRFFPGESDFRTEQNDPIHSPPGFADCIDNRRCPFALPDVAALL